jgi:Amt family ammonium transporter
MDLPNYALDTFYFLIMGTLVMWMAAGFTMLEAGSVRSKNVIEILLKNVSLYSVASIGFLLIGYGIMYGWAPPDDHALWADFFFQVVFVATAMSVVSGAVAERKKLWTFLLFAAIFTTFIYPIQGAWSWGGGWLSERGFFDFAGSGIVHLAGATAALAGVLILGPRKGKYLKDGTPRPIHGSNAAQVALGTLILWMGWFGFNGGSQLAISGFENANAVAKIFVNTNTAAASGLIVAMIFSKLWLGKTALNAVCNGALAGLVVITADPLTPEPWQAMIYGGLGGLMVPYAMSYIEKKGIDDPVGAISVHGVAGILGLMLVPILNTEAMFLEQAIGTLSIFTFVFGTSYLLWWGLDKTIGIRVGEQEEVGGSDMWEAGTKAYPYFMRGHGDEYDVGRITDSPAITKEEE